MRHNVTGLISLGQELGHFDLDGPHQQRRRVIAQNSGKRSGEIP
jgi:hypothetical protein